MAEEGGVIADTVASAKHHPWLIGGSIVGLVVLFYFLSGTKSPAVQQFTYASGPSDAALTANAAMQVATTQANAASTIAATQATANTAIAGDYFDYLAGATSNTNAANVSIAGIAGNTAVKSADDASQTAIAQAMYANNTANTAAAYANQTALGVAGYAASTAVTQAQLQAQTTQQLQSYNWSDTQAQIGSTERITADQLSVQQTLGLGAQASANGQAYANYQLGLAQVASNERIQATKMAADFAKGYAP